MIVGDRVETDIAMGKQLGLATILVLSGVTRSDDPRIAALAEGLATYYHHLATDIGRTV